nr:hypothetical protein [bacterium]
MEYLYRLQLEAEQFQLIGLEVLCMPSIDTDTRLVMTILFVGAVSGVNVFFYSQVNDMLLFGQYIHAVLFGILTVGGIMVLKAMFDLVLNEYIENFLLQRQINAYWNRKARDEENRKRVRDSFRAFQQTNFGPQVYGDNILPQMPMMPKQEATVSPTFLTGFNE